ncbi:MAG: thiamine phosphate synthase [Polyangiaceae bacterium]|nr:thiamine phosphate synthase [Polyangiaceae bacterium]
MTPRLVAVTDAARPLAAHLGPYRVLADALGAGLVVLVRLPGRDAREVLDWAGALLDAGHEIAIADRGDVARARGVTRLHLGEASVSVRDARAWMGEGAWVTRACHDPSRPDRDADAVLLSPIFTTPGKGPPLGLGAIGVASARATVIALGGVDADRARACLAAGAHGVAAIRACLDAPADLARVISEATGA